MCSLQAKGIVKALVKFCSIFGLPKFVQTDQSSNFMSRLFGQALEEFSIKHNISSVYHPESQGSIKRFSNSEVNVEEILI